MAYALSRVSSHKKIEIKGLDITIHMLTPTMSRVQVETIQKATQEDTTLQLLIQQMIKGWPKEGCRKHPDVLKPYWQFSSVERQVQTIKKLLPDVMKIIPIIIWLSKSFGQPSTTAIYSHQQSFSSTDS